MKVDKLLACQPCNLCYLNQSTRKGYNVIKSCDWYSVSRDQPVTHRWILILALLFTMEKIFDYSKCAYTITSHKCRKESYHRSFLLLILCHLLQRVVCNINEWKTTWGAWPANRKLCYLSTRKDGKTVMVISNKCLGKRLKRLGINWYNYRISCLDSSKVKLGCAKSHLKFLNSI